MKTSTTTQLQLEKLDRVALDNLRKALPHYTKLTDIAVSGTPLTNQDAIVHCSVVRVGMDWVFQSLVYGLRWFVVFTSRCVFPCLAFVLPVKVRLPVQSGSTNNECNFLEVLYL